jgi:hypothetical protein
MCEQREREAGVGGFTHSVCVCVYMCVCMRAHACVCMSVQVPVLHHIGAAVPAAAAGIVGDESVHRGRVDLVRRVHAPKRLEGDVTNAMLSCSTPTVARLSVLRPRTPNAHASTQSTSCAQ